MQEGLLTLGEDGVYHVVDSGIIISREILFQLLHGLGGGNQTPAELAQEIIDALKEMDNE